ncbi:unnamed protein product, partial [Didymodactylos carnosus]
SNNSKLEENDFLKSIPLCSIHLFIELDIKLYATFDCVVQLLQKFVHLEELSIKLFIDYTDRCSFINGQKWKLFFTQYLPKLKIFHFFCRIDDRIDMNDTAQILSTFQTDFWLKEKQWEIFYTDFQPNNSVFHTKFYPLKYLTVGHNEIECLTKNNN